MLYSLDYFSVQYSSSDAANLDKIRSSRLRNPFRAPLAVASGRRPLSGSALGLMPPIEEQELNSYRKRTGTGATDSCFPLACEGSSAPGLAVGFWQNLAASRVVSAPVERVIDVLRREQALSESQLLSVGVNPDALRRLGIEFERVITNQVFVGNVRASPRLASLVSSQLDSHSSRSDR